MQGDAYMNEAIKIVVLNYAVNPLACCRQKAYSDKKFMYMSITFVNERQRFKCLQTQSVWDFATVTLQKNGFWFTILHGIVVIIFYGLTEREWERERERWMNMKWRMDFLSCVDILWMATHISGLQDNEK